ncbi:MAG: hypothetical protein QW083_01170 [Methanomassiliicoccales archaeon]
MKLSTQSIYIQEGAFNLLIAPEEVALTIFNEHLDLQNYLLLYISGNYSTILSRLNRRFSEFDVRRAFTVFQLIKILKEHHHSFIFIEYDPTLFSEHEELSDQVLLLLRELASSTTVLLYSPRVDQFIQAASEKAHRVFFVTEFDRRVREKIPRPVQRKLEEFAWVGVRRV